MNQRSKILRQINLQFFLIFLFAGMCFHAQSAIPERNQPSGLTVVFVSHTGQVFRNGYPVNTPLYQALNRKENFQFAEIGRKQPFFGWIVNSDQNNTAQTAYQILVASSLENIQKNTGDCWYNMIRVGSTISLEAWDNKYKPNQDWNHVWGAAPANIIPRKLMGIEPLEPGFRKIRIKPQPASLKHAEIKCPTIRGDVLMSFKNLPQQSFSMNLTIPANTAADVYLPFRSKSQKVTMNGNLIKYRQEGNFAVVEGVGSGENVFELTR